VSDRSGGRVFDSIAADYDRNRPTYPEKLVTEAVELASLEPGDSVLELGCGSGQLTGSLLRRGLRVTAVEPGEQLIALARRRLAGAGEVAFVNARLEDAPPQPAAFKAAFAASSFHWVDPDVSWRIVARSLVPGGTFVLIQYFGLTEDWSAADQEQLVTTVNRIAPQAGLRIYPDHQQTLGEIERRAGNLSDVWAWLTKHELARDHVSILFDQARCALEPVRLEHTSAQLTAMLATMSFWARLAPGQRREVEHDIRLLNERLGRSIRSSAVAVAVAAKRSAEPVKG
jgi:ubiquinone/menaquinone biosynthesis C-methylase UbiE